MRGGSALWRASCFIAITMLFSGCTASKKIGKVLMDSDIQVGSLADQPASLRITLLAEPDINQNESEEATPIALQVIYLSEDSGLLAADFDQLNDENADLGKILKKNYIDHQDYQLLPGQFKPLDPVTLEEKNQYVGVIASYADENGAEWKKVIKAKGKGHRYHLLIHVRARVIELQMEEE